jgi:hypothetical protein
LQKERTIQFIFVPKFHKHEIITPARISEMIACVNSGQNYNLAGIIPIIYSLVRMALRNKNELGGPFFLQLAVNKLKIVLINA